MKIIKPPIANPEKNAAVVYVQIDKLAYLAKFSGK